MVISKCVEERKKLDSNIWLSIWVWSNNWQKISKKNLIHILHFNNYTENSWSSSLFFFFKFWKTALKLFKAKIWSTIMYKNNRRMLFSVKLTKLIDSSGSGAPFLGWEFWNKCASLCFREPRHFLKTQKIRGVLIQVFKRKCKNV